MTDEKRKFRRRKLFLTLFHIIFVSMSVFGISAMYLNSNYGKGVSGYMRMHTRILLSLTNS